MRQADRAGKVAAQIFPAGEVKVVGVWDTVGSVGVAAGNIPGISRSQFDYLQTGLRIHILNGYHALAIDEHRNDFAPTVWDVRHPKDPNAVNRYNQGRVSAHGVRTRLDHADVLARAVCLDMVQAGWKPTVDNYLGRVTKPRILEAVREARGESSAQLIDHLKKGDMAKEAERLLDGSGWLPEPLRFVDPTASPAEQEAEAGPLPEFLADAEDQENASDDDPQQLDAAE
ncbi:hypothetical protein ABIA95_005409 [Bradyrhizobium sp. LA8.1]